jgi:hypothetical protein
MFQSLHALFLACNALDAIATARLDISNDLLPSKLLFVGESLTYGSSFLDLFLMLSPPSRCFSTPKGMSHSIGLRSNLPPFEA